MPHGMLAGLDKTKLSLVPNFYLEKTFFQLSNNLTLSKVSFIGSLPKYSWELLSDFFNLERGSIFIDIDAGKPFAMFIGGMIVLVDGSASIPFEIDVPFSTKQNLTIRLPANKEPRISLKQLTGILTTATRSKFPTVLEPFLPELILQKLDVLFNEKLTAFEIVELRGVCSTSWDLGGLGVISITNVTVYMTPQIFTLTGYLLLGDAVLELELTNYSSAGPTFRLVKPTDAFGIEQIVKDALNKMNPGLKILPDVNLLGLDIAYASSVQFAEVQLSNYFDSLNSFSLVVKISKTWSFFKSCCSLIAPTMNLHVKDLSDIPSYMVDITGSLELVDKNKRLVLPLECNIPQSLQCVITLKLRSAVIFELSDITVLPLVGKLIPPGLLTPVSDFIGNVRLWPLKANFEPLTARMNTLSLTATALRDWQLNGFPLTLRNITLDINIGQNVQATLMGNVFLKAHPISFQIPFPPTSPNLPEMKMEFQGFPNITLIELGQQLIGGFSVESLFPAAFDKFKISLKFLHLRLSSPLRSLKIQSFSLSFSQKDHVTLVDKWLQIKDITADLDVKLGVEFSVAGRLACLVRLGTGAHVLEIRGIIKMPHISSEAWELNILSGQANIISATDIVGLTGGGFDLKSLFPDNILSKADRFILKNFRITFTPNPRFKVYNLTCLLEANLSDVWLPLKIKIQHIRINLFIESPFPAVKRTIKVTIYVEIQLGKVIVPTTLSVLGDIVHLEIQNLENQPLTMHDLASLIGGDQLLKSVPVEFLNFKKVTLSRLSMTFSKPQFELLNASVRCDLYGFDVGFRFPLPIPDPSNIFKATLVVQYLEFNLKRNKDWELTAGIKASFTGIPLEKHFSDLEGLLTVTSSESAMFTIKKNLLDLRINKKLAGIDCNLNIKFSDPKITFVTPREPALGITLDVSGFDALNKLLPFRVFKHKLSMDVLITEKTGMAIELKTIPIMDNLIPCKKEREEYICDFTWLCQEDSYVRLKLPSLAYTRDGFSAIIDVKGLDKLCIPLVLPFMKDFFKYIPFLYGLLKHNIPLWPPPDIIGSLNAIGCNVDNLPKGMEH